MATTMTALELSALKPGDTLLSTDDLSGYPHYHVLAGATLVVVENGIGEDHGSFVAVRLAPKDKDKLVDGDISEWCDAIHLHEPSMAGVEHDAGTDPADRAAPGNAWTKHTVDLVPAPDALSLAERVAAVFAHRLAEELGEERMAEVIRRNAAETRPGVCHSHDLCDPNMDMLAAFEAMGLKTPLDALDDPSLGTGPEELWNEAWGIAKTSWFVAPGWAMNPENDDDEDDMEAAPSP